ncbi:hypothetical protein BXZ70DRAFT_382295 [Cristinia sonorae]|uniref:Uncharacterized protein n=1 Tax=Cristinia sonorae TaxID=1940300 RepID=A0A8K0XN39_9AGAR|nr:hypothetical protein BXZ70DRAFT_382295 [Cristinia sonorae]
MEDTYQTQATNNIVVSSSRTPLLPPELIDEVIRQAWSSDLTIPERTSLYTTYCLVNRTWLSLFIRAALVDVHIISPAFADYYLFLVHQPSGSESRETSKLLPNASETANRLCRSINFHVDNNPNRGTSLELPPAIRLYADSHKMAETVSSTLYMIDTLGYTPNLQHVTLDYVDWGFGDVFDQMRLSPLPPQVTSLEIIYSYSKELKDTSDSIKKSYSRQPYPMWKTSTVRKLSVAGAPAGLVNAFVLTCPCVEVLEVSGLSSFDHLDEMPDSLHTLVLHLDNFNGATDGRKQDFGLDESLLRKWFAVSSEVKRKVVLCSEASLRTRFRLPDPVASWARKFGLEIITRGLT